MTNRDAEDPLTGVEWPKTPAPSAECTAKIRAMACSELEPNRGLSLRARLSLSLAFCLGASGLLLWMMVPAAAPAKAIPLAWGVAGWLAVQTGVLLVGFARLGQGRSRRTLALAFAIGAPLAFIGYLTLVGQEFFALGDFWSAAEHRHGVLRCGAASLMISVMATAAVMWVWRRTDPFTPSLSGAMAGLAGGLVGAVVTDAACPGREDWHLWLGHGLSLGAIVIVASLVGRRVLSP